jgi:hypothetical protein
MSPYDLLCRVCQTLAAVCILEFSPPEITRDAHLDVPHQKALRENAERAALGLRPVGKDWICFRSFEDSGDEWLSDPKREPAAIKNIKRNRDSSLLSETDTYFKGQDYQPEEGTPYPESFIVNYDYTTRKFSFTYFGNERSIERMVERAEETYQTEGRINPQELVSRVLGKWTPTPSH